MDMNSKLPKFLSLAASARFVWGHFDCGLWLGKWYSMAHDTYDPSLHLHGAYSDKASCLALCGPLGPARMVDHIAKSVGLKHTKDPLPGDIGLLRALGKKDAVGTIRTRKGWVILTPGGINHCGITLIIPEETRNVRLMTAWRV